MALTTNEKVLFDVLSELSQSGSITNEQQTKLNELQQKQGNDYTLGSELESNSLNDFVNSLTIPDYLDEEGMHRYKIRMCTQNTVAKTKYFSDSISSLSKKGLSTQICDSLTQFYKDFIAGKYKGDLISNIVSRFIYSLPDSSLKMSDIEVANIVNDKLAKSMLNEHIHLYQRMVLDYVECSHPIVQGSNFELAVLTSLIKSIQLLVNKEFEVSNKMVYVLFAMFMTILDDVTDIIKQLPKEHINSPITFNKVDFSPLYVGMSERFEKLYYKE